MPVTATMLMVATVASTVVSAGVGIAQAVTSASAAKKQRNLIKQKARIDAEARRVSMKEAAYRTQQEKLKVRRERRVFAGRLVQGASNAGIGSSSSMVIGAQTSMRSQAGQNLGNLNMNQNFSSTLAQLSQQSADALSKYQKIGAKQDGLNSIFGGIKGVAGAVSSASGGMKAFGANAAGNPRVPTPTNPSSDIGNAFNYAQIKTDIYDARGY